MRRTALPLAAFAALVGATGAAQAADFGAPPPPQTPPCCAPAAASVIEPGGWYIRGDIGLGVHDGRLYEQQLNGGVTPNTGSWQQQSLGRSAVIGGGIGYQFSEWLRGDLTAEYRSDVAIQGTGRESFSANSTTYTGTGEIRGSINTATVMATAYADLGTFGGITPYVGVGLGAAYNEIRGTQTSINPIPDGSGGITRYDTVHSTYSKKGGWDLAWALHAGASYDVNERLKIDAGYRYMNVGDASTGNLVVTSNGNVGTTPLSAKDHAIHDFRVGFRYMLEGGSAYKPSFEETPSFAAAPPQSVYSGRPVVAKN